ncbi:hypothetical protein Dcar01_01389 [Deinococcus carri]|uniref:Uncharacterized protein n=1 Tax=Deinococcus carri TaxID=1211323 RepID=A0ABP9W5Q3_9DEIO
MRVLNVPVPPGLPDAWAGWLAPARQPFFLTGEEAQALGLRAVLRSGVTFTPEQRDTYALWNLRPEADRVVWLGQEDWRALPPASRRALLRAQVRHGRAAVPRTRDFADLLPHLTGARFVWWPSLVSPAVLARVLSTGRPACQSQSVPAEVWADAASLLPQAQELAGTWPRASGPNCFGTVMGAAGVAGAAEEWMQREPFEAFLAARTRPGGQDDQPGTLLVWRDVAGAVQHAAVTLGGGWALHKPSQSWMTPRVALPVDDLIRSCRTRGWRLYRSRLRV